MRINYLVNHFQKSLTPEQVAGAVEQLVKAELIGGVEAALAYEF
ncbi:MAG TPA: hypothetical protein VNO53_08895 [Steroidobacteraceae bacterium]|nr:hypothetical protein [Steroidobacteraceae bacterium]